MGRLGTAGGRGHKLSAQGARCVGGTVGKQGVTDCERGDEGAGIIFAM